MPPSYPCLQCLFCKQLFATAKSLNSHLDHYLPEYCAATGAQPRRTAHSSHPIPAIRYVRADATRTVEIRWEKDTVRPPDGVLWSFAVPVPNKAVKTQNARGGLKSAQWWLKFLRAIPVIPDSDDESIHSEDPDEDDDEAFSDAEEPVNSEPQSPKHRLQARDIGGRRIHAEYRRDCPLVGVNVSNGSDHNRVELGVNSKTHGRPRNDKSKAPLELIDLSSSPRPPSSWRHKDPHHRRHIRFRKTSSPFYLPSTPPTRFTLRVAFFADVYALPITSATSLAGAMRLLRDASDAGFDDAVWSTLAIAPQGEKEQWTDAQWEKMKEAAMYNADEEVLGRVVRRK